MTDEHTPDNPEKQKRSEDASFSVSIPGLQLKLRGEPVSVLAMALVKALSPWIGFILTLTAVGLIVINIMKAMHSQ